MTTQTLTANRLGDGIVVYLADDGQWTEHMPHASIARSAEAGAKLLEIGARAAANQMVIDPYLIDVTEEDGRVQPVRLREAIRAEGPTVETRQTQAASAR